MCVEVEARVTKPESADSFVSNTFSFSFAVDLTASPAAVDVQGRPQRRGLKQVLPVCDEQALKMLTHHLQKPQE